MLPTPNRARTGWIAALAAALAAGLLASVAPAGAGPDGRPAQQAREAPPAQAPRPNVVVVLLDDMRADQLRFLPRTRTLIGDHGTTYTHALSPHPLCCPARASLVTGQYTQNHGVKSNFPPSGGFPALRRPGNTVGRWLAREGYRTGWIGKYLNEYRTEHGRQRGWHTWQPLVRNLYTYEDPVFYGDARPTRGYVTSILRRRTDRFLSARGKRPFFLVAGHVAPHGTLRGGRWVPPVAAAPYLKAYRELRPSSFRKPSYAERAVGDLPPDLRVRKPSRRYLRGYARGSARALRSVDDAIASVVRRLRRTGELANTYVVVTSDNGFLLGEHRIVDKDVLFDEALDVPLLVRGPGIPAGATDPTPVTLVDLVASILEWTDVRPGRRIDGVPLDDTGDRDTILVQTGAQPRSAALPRSERRQTGALARRRSEVVPGRPSSDDNAASAPGWGRAVAGSQRIEAVTRPTALLNGGWGYRGVTTARYLYARKAGSPRQGLLFDRTRDPYQLRNRYGDRRYRAVQRELARRTAALGRCAGAAGCNRVFGAVPDPAAASLPGSLVVEPALLTHESRAAYPDPVLTTAPVGDPSLVRTGRGTVLVATGTLVPRARWDRGKGWRWTRPALRRLPSWARAGGVWAADIARVGKAWRLYYSAPVAGLGKDGRCIGVAVAPSAYARFRPVGRRPLVCPPRARTPDALDQVPGGEGLPKRGIIDPSLFVDDGRPFLLYKTDGIPSSIRLLPLDARGTAPRKDERSRELLRSDGVVENPVMLRHDDDYVLLTSEGDYSRCTYRETWRRSPSLTDWSAAARQPLLSRRSTGGLCGPGGADVLETTDRTTIWFHGWVREGTTRPPEPPFWFGHRGPRARRVLYGAALRMVDGGPAIGRWLG